MCMQTRNAHHFYLHDRKYGDFSLKISVRAAVLVLQPSSNSEERVGQGSNA